ncbi:MAG: F0F1 ATP synthase subunit B [Bacteroidales bacterium]|nr:F0F1 ATP synthase subunit B [Bacteroidales bacterium]
MDLMLPDSGLLFWMTVIFGLVLFILAKFGFPMITGMVEKRNKRISDSLEAARIAEEALANLQQEQERLISETRSEQARLMQEAAAERDRMIAQAQEQARAEAQKIMDDARVRINEEKEAVMQEIRNEVALVSLSIAEKVVRKDLSSDASQKELVDKLINELENQVT